MRPGASVGYVRAMRTGLPHWVRTGGAGWLGPRAPRTVRTGPAYRGTAGEGELSVHRGEFVTVVVDV